MYSLIAMVKITITWVHLEPKKGHAERGKSSKTAKKRFKGYLWRVSAVNSPWNFGLEV